MDNFEQPKKANEKHIEKTMKTHANQLKTNDNTWNHSFKRFCLKKHVKIRESLKNQRTTMDNLPFFTILYVVCLIAVSRG